VFIEVFSIFAPVFSCLKLCFRRHCSRLRSNGGEVPSFPECGIYLFLIFTLQFLVLHCLMFRQYWQPSWLILDKHGMLSISQVWQHLYHRCSSHFAEFLSFQTENPSEAKKGQVHTLLSSTFFFLRFGASFFVSHPSSSQHLGRENQTHKLLIHLTGEKN
jgi:hypothetical protein